MSKNFPACSHLTDAEDRLLLTVYVNHKSSMGLEKRKNYTLSDIVKVERNAAEKCLNVHYRNGDWWHYCSDGTWY